MKRLLYPIFDARKAGSRATLLIFLAPAVILLFWLVTGFAPISRVIVLGVVGASFLFYGVIGIAGQSIFRFRLWLWRKRRMR